MDKTIRLIVVDLDNTLLNSEHKMSERNEKALKAAIEKGAQVILATGKTPYSGQEIVQRLNLTLPGIYVQGLVIAGPDGAILHQKTMDADIARRVITFAEDRGFLMAAYTRSTIVMRYSNPYQEFFHKFGEPIPEVVGPLQNVLDDMPVNKLLAMGDPQRLKSLRWQLNMQLNSSIQMTQSHVETVLEILPSGASKAVALKALLNQLDVPARDVLAIGDAENDIGMFQLAGIGVAVGNADEKTQAAADYVVATNENDGVAEAVERFVLGIDPSAATAPAAQPAAESKPEAEAQPAAEAKPAAATPSDEKAEEKTE